MEERADYLVQCGRAIPPSKWVTGLIRRGAREHQGDIVSGLI